MPTPCSYPLSRCTLKCRSRKMDYARDENGRRIKKEDGKYVFIFYGTSNNNILE